MAQLRAKQIKLANANDLLIGGTGGNGTVLAAGADKTVLKVVAGGLQYAMQVAEDVTFADASFTASKLYCSGKRASTASTSFDSKTSSKELNTFSCLIPAFSAKVSALDLVLL